MPQYHLSSTFELESANKTVWIFGAGASAGHPYNVPMQNSLLTHLFKMSASGHPTVQKELVQLRKEVKELCSRVQPGLPIHDVSLEEVFSAYELQASSSYSTQEEVEYALTGIEKLRTALRFATRVYGNGQVSKWTPHRRKGAPASYVGLLEKLFPVKCDVGQLKSHVFATMNYDINFDRCLINMLDPEQGGITLDYGIEFGDYRLQGSFRRPNSRSVLLLRLHGGLNWIRCKTCQGIFTTIDRHANVVKTDKCRLCKCNRLELVLVHPSYVRKYDDPILQLIWGRFQEELINSDRWVFVGYSMPTADVHLREALRHVLRIRKSRRNETKIFWVGRKESENDHNFDIVAKNYHSVFEDDVIGWNATAGGFADFVGIL